MRRKFLWLIVFSHLNSLFPIEALAVDLANGYDQSAIEEAQLVARHTAILNGYKEYLAKVAVQDCKDVLAQHKSGILISFVDKKTHQESQVMIECKPNGTADAFSAEEVALRIEAAKRNPNPSSCALLPDRNLQSLYLHADRVADIVGAHAGKCENNIAPADTPVKAAKQTSSCIASLEESFFSSWKGAGSSGAPNCLQTLINVFFDNIVSTGKFMVDMASGAAKWTGDKLAGLWNSMMNSDNRNSNSVLAASALSHRDVKALSKNDKDSLWSVFQRFSSNVLLGINHLMTDYVGCQHWSGQPFHSQCVAPLNFACITCGQGLNLACGVIGIIGSEAVMFLAGGFASGGIASVVGSLAKTPQVISALNGLSSMRALVAAAEISSSIAARARALNVAARAMPGVGKTMAHAGALSRLPRTVMNNLVSRVPLNTEMRALYAGSVRLGAKSGDKLMEAVGVGKVTSSVIHKVELLTTIERARDKFLRDSVTIFRASGQESAAKLGKIRAAYRAYMEQAKKSFEAMGYTVDAGPRGSLLISDPQNKRYFTYEIKSISSRLSTMRKSDSIMQVMEYLKKEDTLFASPAAYADHVSTNLMPSELAEAIAYRRSIEPKVGFEAHLATHELGRYQSALNTDAKYNVNPHSKFIPTAASIY